MEEKKKRKINLIAILLIVAIVVNVATFCYIGIDKINDNKTIAEYEENASALQKMIDDLQDESGTLKGELEAVTDRTDEPKYTVDEMFTMMNFLLYDFYDDDIIDALARVLFYRGAVATMKAKSAEGFPYVPFFEPPVFKTINGLAYEKKDMRYDDIVRIYSTIFTGNALEEFLDIRFADVDGDLYVLDGGMSGWTVSSAKLTRVSESDGEIKYSVSLVSDFGSDEFPNKVEDTCSMTIKLVDGNYRISEFDYCKN